MVTFAGEVAASFPSQVTLPPEFRLALRWMEANGFVHPFRRRDGRYASLFPSALENRSSSSITITAVDPAHARGWFRIDAAASTRLAPFIRTGGDGSSAALWLDDDGPQRFVHMGSGSGSVMMCVIADSAVDMLRLLAIGYDEICWPDDFGLTAAEVLERDGTEDEYTAPTSFRDWVATTFGVSIPERASEIVKATASMDEESSDDPFWRWIRSYDR